jgi:hypothetical protein
MHRTCSEWVPCHCGPKCGHSPGPQAKYGDLAGEGHSK